VDRGHVEPDDRVDTSKSDGSFERYWRVRTVLEVAKFGICVLWEVIKGRACPGRVSGLLPGRLAISRRAGGHSVPRAPDSAVPMQGGTPTGSVGVPPKRS
jgi:hypothetical protein